MRSAVAAAALSTFGAIAAEACNAILPWYTTPLWFVPLFLCHSPAAATSPRSLHATAAMASAWTATMLGVRFGGVPGPDAQRAADHHPAFGQHPVLECTGFPWRGIEGNGLGLAHDRIPFDMGVDALAANFATWLACAWLLVALVPRCHHRGLACGAALAALVAGASGTWHLVVLFD